MTTLMTPVSPERVPPRIEVTEGSNAAAAAEASYYEDWLAALSRFLIDSGTLTAEEITARAAEFAAGERTAAEWIEGERDHVHGDGHTHDGDHVRSYGTDHPHGHDHSHGDAGEH